MIDLPSPKAVNAAFTIANMGHKDMQYVKLASDGFMYATNGFAAIVSEGQHDTQMFIRATKKPSLSGSAVSVHLDVEESQIVEVRPRSEARHDVEIIKEVPYPPVENLRASHLWTTPQQPLFDSIPAANIANAYGLSRGVWSAGPSPEGAPRVYLQGTEEGDTILLSCIRS